MAGYEWSISSVNFNFFVNRENYSQLLNAFKETHKEANMLVLSNNKHKGLNNWLKNRATTPKEELSNAIIDFEKLEIIYKNSSRSCVESIKSVKNCKTCKALQSKVHYVSQVCNAKSKYEIFTWITKLCFS